MTSHRQCRDLPWTPHFAASHYVNRAHVIKEHNLLHSPFLMQKVRSQLDLEPGKKNIDKVSQRQNYSILRKWLISTISIRTKLQHDHGQQILIFCLMPLTLATKTGSTILCFGQMCTHVRLFQSLQKSARLQIVRVRMGERWAVMYKCQNSVVSARICDFFFSHLKPWSVAPTVTQ